METLEFTKKQFEKLQKFELGENIVSTECQLFLTEQKSKWMKEQKILKCYFNQEGRNFSNKLYVINTLIDEKEKICINELVMPEKLLIVDNKVVGFSMPYIPNENLYTKLNNINVPNETKIRYLKEIGKIFEQMATKKKYGNIDRFFLGDVHEQNFIVDSATDKIKIVDLDSCVIGTSQPFPIKMFSRNTAIKDLPIKYHTNGLIVVPDENTDLYCYNIMILNYISKSKINNLNIGEYYSYLEYLDDLGFDHSLISNFNNLYLGCKNENPVNLIESIPNDLSKANYNVFKLKKQKN